MKSIEFDATSPKEQPNYLTVTISRQQAANIVEAILRQAEDGSVADTIELLFAGEANKNASQTW